MQYVINNVQARDQWASQYGTMQSFALSFDGQVGWHLMNQKVETPPPKVGDTIHGEISTATNKNGTEYKKFKKVNPNYANQSQAVSPEIATKLDYVVQMLEELTGRKEVIPTDITLPEDDPFGEI